MPSDIQVDIYSRPNCHLCDEAKEVVERVRLQHSFSLRVINIEADPALESAYGAEVPVVFINGKKAFKYRVDAAELEKKVTSAWKT